MTLLREIQHLAANSDAKVSDVLRQAKILAARLGHAAFKEWVENELNGYPSEDNLPQCRTLHTLSFGYFSGPFGSAMSNAPIPPNCVPKKFRDLITSAHLVDGVSYFEQLMENPSNGPFRRPWDANLTALVGERIYMGMNCISAWQEISVGSIAALLDSVRNRILSFVLEIEAEAPDAGEAPPGSTPLNDARVNQIFNTYIVGGSTVVAGSVGKIQQDSVAPGEIGSLREYLAALGVEAEDLDQLERAIGEDAPPTDSKFGRKVSAWMGGMVAKAASGVWAVSLKAGGEILARALGSYYGVK